MNQDRATSSAGSWDRPLLLTREVVVWAFLLVVAGLSRFWGLGSEPLSLEENRVAAAAWGLFQRPELEALAGVPRPLPVEGVAFAFFLFGVSEGALRALSAGFGVLLVVLPLAFRAWLGPVGAWAAGVLLTLSPITLDASRTAREGVLAVGLLGFLLVTTHRWLVTGERHWLWLAAGLVALLLSTHPAGWVALSFLLGGGGSVWAWGRFTRKRGLIGERVASLTWKDWTRAGAILLGLFLLLETAFLTHPGRLLEWFRLGSTPPPGSLLHWSSGLLLLGRYEILTCLLTVWAGWQVSRTGREPGGRELVVREARWLLGLLVGWITLAGLLLRAGISGPWDLLFLLAPMSLLAGWGVGRWVEGLTWEKAFAPSGIGLLGLAIFGVILLVLWGVAGRWDDLLHPTGMGVVAAALLLALVGSLIIMGSVRRWRHTRPLLGFFLLGLLGLQALRLDWRIAFGGSLPADFLRDPRASSALLLTADELRELTLRLSASGGWSRSAERPMVFLYDEVLFDPAREGLGWWYFRGLPGFVPLAQGAPAADGILLAGETDPSWRRGLETQYIRREVRQEIRGESASGSWRWRSVWAGLKAPQSRARWVRQWLVPDAGSPIPGRTAVLYLRRDLAQSLWASGRLDRRWLEVKEAYARRWRGARVEAIWGEPDTKPGQFTGPRNLAVDRGGRVYVLDTGGQRVLVFDGQGTLKQAWGQSDQLVFPWGIATGPEGAVYIADTWSHRVLKFDGEGRLLLQWGVYGWGPGQFYGPRGLTVGPDGTVYVVDSGNNRVQVFGPGGEFRGMWGQAGTAPGAFREPVGIAVNQETGWVYVGDTWNQRIQRFGPAGEYLGEWPVRGWEGASGDNKPYLATDQKGRVYATDPEAGRVLVFSPEGVLLRVWGPLGVDGGPLELPTGVAVAPSGAVYLVEARAARVRRLAPLP